MVVDDSDDSSYDASNCSEFGKDLERMEVDDCSDSETEPVSDCDDDDQNSASQANPVSIVETPLRASSVSVLPTPPGTVSPTARFFTKPQSAQRTASFFLQKWMRLDFISSTQVEFLYHDPQAQAILQAYCDCYKKWVNDLMPLLKLKDGLVHSPLSDSNSCCHFCIHLAKFVARLAMTVQLSSKSSSRFWVWILFLKILSPWFLSPTKPWINNC
jgi:hypothetical protein